MKRRHILIILFLILISGSGIYFLYINPDIKNQLKSNYISILHNENKISNSEVSDIKQKIIDLKHNIVPDMVVSDKSSLVKLIVQNIIDGKDTTVTIKDSSIRNNINVIANTAAEDYGYSGYISDLTYAIKGTKVYLHFDYKNGKDYFFSCINAVNSKVKSITAKLIVPGMSDFDKELAIHDYVVNHVKYDYDGLQNNTLTVDDFTAYGALIKGKCVCQGYSEALYRLLNTANIKNYIVLGTGNKISHSWNIAKIRGSYYHLDATFDDPVSNFGSLLSYGYFNLSDSQIAVDHTWDKSRYPKCINISENYYVVNHLIANNRSDFYDIVKKALSKKYKVIRCKTARYDINTFNPSQVVSSVITDNQIGYINLKKGLVYNYNKETNEMQIFITYK